MFITAYRLPFGILGEIGVLLCELLLSFASIISTLLLLSNEFSCDVGRPWSCGCCPSYLSFIFGDLGHVITLFWTKSKFKDISFLSFLNDVFETSYGLSNRVELR